MITFTVNKDNSEKKFECSFEDSILSLKQRIIKDFELTCDYIDIDFILEIPIRSLGKFNLESGIFRIWYLESSIFYKPCKCGHLQ